MWKLLHSNNNKSSPSIRSSGKAWLKDNTYKKDVLDPLHSGAYTPSRRDKKELFEWRSSVVICTKALTFLESVEFKQGLVCVPRVQEGLLLD